MTEAPKSYLRSALMLCLGVSLWAFNAIVTATILPSAVSEIGGVALMSWATTAYFAASIVSSAAGAWGASRFGHRGAVSLAATVFALGCCVCALAPSMPVLLAGRFVQGAGAGLATALCYVFVRVLLAETHWQRIFALFAVVWGVASLAGPAVGGMLTELVNWRAAFLFMMLPAVALLALARNLLNAGGAGRSTPPFPGLRLSLVAAGMMAIGAAGDRGLYGAGLGLAGVALLVLAWAIDGRSTHPLLPTGAGSPRSAVGLGLFFQGTLILASMPSSVYLALSVQAFYGASPLLAGYVYALEALGWATVAYGIARLATRWGARLAVLGPILVGSGEIALALLLDRSPLWLIAVATAIVGIGFGLCWSYSTSRILLGAPKGEEDRTASAATMIEAMAIGMSAALVGSFSQLLGIGEAGTSETLVHSVRLLLAGFGAVAVLPFIAGLLLVRAPQRGS